MYVFPEKLASPPVAPRPRLRHRTPAPAATVAARLERTPSVMLPWVRAQAINVNRHAAALRPFRRNEFGDTAASPTEGHLRAVNELIKTLRDDLLKLTAGVTHTADAATSEPSTRNL